MHVARSLQNLPDFLPYAWSRLQMFQSLYAGGLIGAGRGGWGVGSRGERGSQMPVARSRQLEATKPSRKRRRQSLEQQECRRSRTGSSDRRPIVELNRRWHAEIRFYGRHGRVSLRSRVVFAPYADWFPLPRISPSRVRSADSDGSWNAAKHSPSEM